MKTFYFEASQLVPRPRNLVFQFFSDAGNLEAITPSWLNFHVETPAPVEMREGALIDYRLRVHGIPLRWQSKITLWSPPHRFVDEQIRGPYGLWRHDHVFDSVPGGTQIHDRVTYAVPGGSLVNWLFVRKDVERIFAHRRNRIESLFPAVS